MPLDNDTEFVEKAFSRTTFLQFDMEFLDKEK